MLPLPSEGLTVRSSARWMRRLILTALILVASIVVERLPLYVFFPPKGSIAGSDLLYVIGPPYQERIDLAQELRSQGAASQIRVSVNPPGKGGSAESLQIAGRPESPATYQIP